MKTLTAGMAAVSPVVPTISAHVRSRPIGLRGATVTGGLWGERRHINREVTMPHGARQLELAGNLANLRAAAAGSGSYRAGADDSGLTFPFLDSDVYKWLEAVGWELATAPNEGLSRAADEAIDLVVAAQREDGYLNSYFQLATPGRQFHDMEWGHELYTIGHLVQAAVAWTRSTGDERLMEVAQRAVARVRKEAAAGARELIDGHPGIEMALVELYRVDGDDCHLDLASTLVERRGRGLLRPDRFGPDYWQDHAAVRDAGEPAGHAVRQLYLDCGIVDLAVELGDMDLLDGARRRWEAMVASRTYLTGGLGARPRDEAFGLPYELPPDSAYAETCAAIASVMLAWRLLLATGDSRYGDLIERTSLNAVLVGIARDGSHFAYANPLQVRSGAQEVPGPTSVRRRSWFACACCPPNLMRFLATYPDLVATYDDDGITLHQFAAGSVEVDAPPGPISLRVDTDYPWTGSIEISVVRAPGTTWELRARVPVWCGQGRISVEGEPERSIEGGPFVAERRPWREGDRLRIELDMPPRITWPDPRIDAVRGTAAIERGPLVYAVEEVDLPQRTSIDSIELDPSSLPAVAPPDRALPDVALLDVTVRRVAAPSAEWPYSGASEPARPAHPPITVRVVPYFAWGNRGPGGMRVWIPAGH